MTTHTHEGPAMPRKENLVIRKPRNAAEIDQAYELVARIFGHDYTESRETQVRIRTLESPENLEDAVVVARDGEIVGFARILDRQLSSPIGCVKAGGITSVCVHPDYRGSGLGIGLVEAALGRSRHRGDVLSILFARRAVDGWYPRTGYVGIGCHHEMRIDRLSLRNMSLPSFAGRIERGIVESYSSTYAAAYADSYHGLFLSFCRDERWWQSLGLRLEGRVEINDVVNVVTQQGPIGYFILKDGRIIEAASPRQHRGDLIAGIVQHGLSGDGEGLVLALPLSHWCITFFRGMNHTQSIRHSWDGGHMVRILKKGMFRAIVKGSMRHEFHSSIDRLFEQYDVSDNEDAKHLLLGIVGASPTSWVGRKKGEAAISGSALLQVLPSWSIVDEF